MQMIIGLALIFLVNLHGRPHWGASERIKMENEVLAKFKYQMPETDEKVLIMI